MRQAPVSGLRRRRMRPEASHPGSRLRHGLYVRDVSVASSLRLEQWHWCRRVRLVRRWYGLGGNTPRRFQPGGSPHDHARLHLPQQLQQPGCGNSRPHQKQLAPGKNPGHTNTARIASQRPRPSNREGARYQPVPRCVTECRKAGQHSSGKKFRLCISCARGAFPVQIPSPTPCRTVRRPG